MLPRDQRLTRSDDVRAVLRRGQRRAGAVVVVHVRRRGDDDPGRVAVVASRRVGNAVERNRAKRVLRAAVAAHGIPRGVDLALVARRAATESRAPDAQRDIEQVFDALAVAA